MGKILDFYTGQMPNDDGLYFNQVMNLSKAELEEKDTSNFIAWLFPLTIYNEYMSDAPLITEEEMKIFNEKDSLKQKVLKAAKLMSSFFFNPVHHSLTDKVSIFQTWPTRVLSFLRMVGLVDEAREFFKKLFLYKDCEGFQYWLQVAPDTPIEEAAKNLIRILKLDNESRRGLAKKLVDELQNKKDMDSVDRILAEFIAAVCIHWGDESPIHVYEYSGSLNDLMSNLFKGFPGTESPSSGGFKVSGDLGTDCIQNILDSAGDSDTRKPKKNK